MKWFWRFVRRLLFWRKPPRYIYRFHHLDTGIAPSDMIIDEIDVRVGRPDG